MLFDPHTTRSLADERHDRFRREADRRRTLRGLRRSRAVAAAPTAPEASRASTVNAQPSTTEPTPSLDPAGASELVSDPAGDARVVGLVRSHRPFRRDAA